MAQQLWLLRHGDAEPHEARDDASRKLTEKGEAQARAAGVALASLGLEFDSVLTSPRVRARETARLACESFGSFDVEPIDALSGGFAREDALEVLAGRDPDARVLLVGHEPDFSQLVHDLAGGRADVKKGGVAALKVARGAGELLLLLRPADLALMARAAS
ncbi:MAG: phosphohistidine phosphatase SixA [Solirubrobacteraceae bacterium]